jgi:hypothetical protein
MVRTADVASFDLGRHHGEAPALLPGLGCLDAGVEGQEVRLVGQVGDRGDDLRDLLGLLGEIEDVGRQRVEGGPDLTHAPDDGAHGVEPVVAGPGRALGQGGHLGRTVVAISEMAADCWLAVVACWLTAASTPLDAWPISLARFRMAEEIVPRSDTIPLRLS